MRLAEMSRDFWELRSGEESARKHPDKFHLPSLELRKSLKRGQAAKLIFEIESQDDAGTRIQQGERMWVVVREQVGEVYICFGAEIPFLPEHVIEIASPPADYVEWQLGQKPERTWPRD